MCMIVNRNRWTVLGVVHAALSAVSSWSQPKIVLRIGFSCARVFGQWGAESESVLHASGRSNNFWENFSVIERPTQSDLVGRHDSNLFLTRCCSIKKKTRCSLTRNERNEQIEILAAAAILLGIRVRKYNIFVSKFPCKHNSQVFDAKCILRFDPHHHHCTAISISNIRMMPSVLGICIFEYVSETLPLNSILRRVHDTYNNVRLVYVNQLMKMGTLQKANTFKSSPASAECKTNRMQMCSNARAPALLESGESNAIYIPCMKSSGWSEVSLPIDNVNEYVKLT